MPSVDAVIERIAANPEAQLGRRSLKSLAAYLIGYDSALQAYGLGPAYDSIDRAAFQSWVQSLLAMTAEHKSRLNAFSCVSPASYAQLISATDYQAFDAYLKLRRDAAHECPNRCPDNDSSRTPPNAEAVSLPTILKAILDRPPMYFGNDCSTHELFAFCNGFLAAELEIGEQNSKNQTFLWEFQAWLDLRYPFGKGRPWGHTVHFLAMGSGDRAFAAFGECLDMYSKGEAPDSADRSEQQMIRSILKCGRSRNGSEENIGPMPD
jgi:hypothetical protein